MDCATWEGKWAIRIRTSLLVVIALALLNGALLSWKDFPAAGLFFSVLGLPIYTTAVHALMASMPCLPRETGFTKFAKVRGGSGGERSARLPRSSGKPLWHA